MTKFMTVFAIFAVACVTMLPAIARSEGDSPDTWTKEEIKAYIDASVEKAVDRAVTKAFSKHNRETVASTTGTGCKCGCVQTGQCVCPNCDSPQTMAPKKMLPTTVGQGYAPFVPETTIYPQESYGYPQQSFYSDAGSGNCANGSCGANNGSGPFRRIIGRWRNR